MEKYSVLTYIIGDYEKVHEIKEKSPNAEYILVTDNKELTSSRLFTCSLVKERIFKGLELIGVSSPEEM